MKCYMTIERGSVEENKYEEGKTYTMEGPVLREHGFQVYRSLVLSLFGQYNVVDITEKLYAEVEPAGEVVWDLVGHGAKTDQIKIVRFLPDSEVLEMVDERDNSGRENTGKANSGDKNTGHWNSGNQNSGFNNSGMGNVGYGNSGDWNTGDANSGDLNTGKGNSGKRNTGGYNKGNYNTGNWNTCHNETGHFNTVRPECIRIFNKPYPIKDLDWGWDFPQILRGNPSEDRLRNADEETKEKIRNLPNYDPAVFEEIFGVRI